MKIKLLLTGVFFVVISNVFSQTNLNNYKYIIVPYKFDFLKEKNQYQINELAKFLFNKHGFNAIMEGEAYPEDLLNNRCLALRSDVLKESGMFKTKLKVELKDCNDRVVYVSQLGESREKEYKKAYNLALRETFEYLGELNYSYKESKEIAALASPSSSAKAETNQVSQEIKELKAEIESLKKKKEEVKQVVNVKEPEPKQVVNPKVVKEIKETSNKKVDTSDILYAQPITNGFQLVDMTPKRVMILLKTGKADLFIVKGREAVVYKESGKWMYSQTSEAGYDAYPINIKF